MHKSVLLLSVLALATFATATPLVQKLDRNSTTQVVLGFADGFIGEKIEDMGQCGTLTVDVILKYQEVFDKLFHGKLESYMKAFMELFEIMTMFPKQVKNCLALKHGLDKLRQRTTKILNFKEFVKSVIFNSVFHSIDIASAMAYAIEDAMDEGYYEMGYESGKALNIFLFNDSNNNFTPVPEMML